MRVGASHDLSLVFKDLHPRILLPQRLRFFPPEVDHPADVFGGESRQAKVVTGGKTEHMTGAFNALAGEEAVRMVLRLRRVRQECGEIVGK
jgi:hypothetical protein